MTAQTTENNSKLQTVIESTRQAIDRAATMDKIEAMHYLLAAVDQIDEVTGGRPLPGRRASLVIHLMAETMTRKPGPYTILRDIRNKIKLELERLQAAARAGDDVKESSPIRIMCRKISSMTEYWTIEDIERDINVLIDKGWIQTGDQLPLLINGNTEKDRVKRSLQIYFHWRNINPDIINKKGKKE